MTTRFARHPFIWFEPDRRFAQDPLRDASKALSSHLLEYERQNGRRLRARKVKDHKTFLVAVEVIAANLIAASLTGRNVALACPRDHTAIWGGGRYRNEVYSQPYLDALKLMEANGLFQSVATGYRFSRKASRPTLVRASKALRRYFPIGEVRWSDLAIIPTGECIILKSAKDKGGAAALISYRDTGPIRKLRDEVHRLNKWLAQANIELLPGHDSIDTEGQPIEPGRRALRRTFNNGKWTEGGRLSGGFWMNMGREERFRRIRIDGEEIANVDFKQLFIRLVYVLRDQRQPGGDLYDIHGDGTCRDGFKLLTNALLFADGPLKRWPEGCRAMFPPGTKLASLVAEIKAHHASVSDCFETGIGFRLFWIESSTLMRILHALFKSGITALPLHDSVLVAWSNAMAAKKCMAEAFKQLSGADGGAFVKIEFCAEK